MFFRAKSNNIVTDYLYNVESEPLAPRGRVDNTKEIHNPSTLSTATAQRHIKYL